MNHAITLGGMLLFVGALIGLVMAAFGMLAVFAGGMSDAPQAGEDTSKQGCVVSAIGAALLIGCILGLVL